MISIDDEVGDASRSIEGGRELMDEGKDRSGAGEVEGWDDAEGVYLSV